MSFNRLFLFRRNAYPLFVSLRRSVYTEVYVVIYGLHGRYYLGNNENSRTVVITESFPVTFPLENKETLQRIGGAHRHSSIARSREGLYISVKNWLLFWNKYIYGASIKLFVKISVLLCILLQ